MSAMWRFHTGHDKKNGVPLAISTPVESLDKSQEVEQEKTKISKWKNC
jgi:hypothetical protein